MELIFLSVLLIVIQLTFLLVVVAGTAIVVAGAISVTLDVPFVPTPPRYRHLIGEALDIEPRDSVYELGSGTGSLLIYLAKTYPDTRFVGVELNAMLYLYANLLKRLRGNPSNVEFRRENFFETDLSQPNKIYGYLLDSVMPKLLHKLEQETNGVRFASRAFQFETKTPVETIRLSKIPGTHGEHMLYVYELTK